MLLFSFSIFIDQRSLKIGNENNSIKNQKSFGHRSLLYGTIGTQERVLVRQGKRVIRFSTVF